MARAFRTLPLPLLVLPIMAGSPAGGAAQSFVSGRVVNALTDAPVLGARVQVDGLPLVAVTRAGGGFRLRVTRTGTYTLLITHPDFHAGEVQVSVHLSAPESGVEIRLVPLSVPAAAAARMRRSITSLEPGSRVRVLLFGAARAITAAVASLEPDTLVLAYPPGLAGSTMPVAVARIDRLELSTARSRLTVHGAAAGALLGALITVAYNGVRFSQCFASCPERRFPLYAGAAVGAAAGGIALSFVRRDRWVPVTLPHSQPLP